MSALRTVTAGVPAEFFFLAETPAPAPTPAPSTAASNSGSGACSDPDKAALLQVRLNFIVPAFRFERCSSEHGCSASPVDVLQREGEACLVSALTNFKAAVALGGASEELKIIVQQLGVVLDGAIDLSKGGSFGF